MYENWKKTLFKYEINLPNSHQLVWNSYEFAKNTYVFTLVIEIRFESDKCFLKTLLKDETTKTWCPNVTGRIEYPSCLNNKRNLGQNVLTTAQFWTLEMHPTHPF